MLYYKKIDVLEGIDINKSNILAIYTSEPYVFNGCHEISMMVYKLENTAILNIKGVDYRI